MISANSILPTSASSLLGTSVASDLKAYVVPGVEIVRHLGIDLENAGLTVTAAPRHANVLLLVEETPSSLRQAANIIYQQMPASKAVLAIGTKSFGPLPQPDVIADSTPESIKQAVQQLRKYISNQSFQHQTSVSQKMRKNPHVGHEMSDMDQGMEHGKSEDMGFMSMVMMTENLPESLDGLKMEWGQVHFGPLHSGLPAGLDLIFMIDGDSIAEAIYDISSVKRNLPTVWLGDRDIFINEFSKLDPLLPNTYRILSQLALGNVINNNIKLSPSQFALLEIERIMNHFNWLASFAMLLGYISLEKKAAKYLQKLQSAKDTKEILSLSKILERFIIQVERDWFLKKRLSGIGVMPQSNQDSWVRLTIRLAEIKKSFAMLKEQKIMREVISLPQDLEQLSGKGRATLKTPRGQASLFLELNNGKITNVSFTGPSVKKLALIDPIVKNLEIADALIAVASLDISPWEAAL